MAKAFWVATYRSVSDPDKLAAYAKLAGPAIQAAGGKFLARGTPAKTYPHHGRRVATRLRASGLDLDQGPAPPSNLPSPP
jgi:uncharacterized protein (DUF1330 family)